MLDLVVDNFAGGGGASCGIEWALGRSPAGKALSLSFCDAAEPPWALQAIALSALPQHFRDTARAIVAADRVPVLVSICAGVEHSCEGRMVGARRPT